MFNNEPNMEEIEDMSSSITVMYIQTNAIMLVHLIHFT